MASCLSCCGFCTKQDVVGPPGKPEAVHIDATQITLSWAPPQGVSDEDTPLIPSLTGYFLEQKNINSCSRWSKVNKKPVTQTSYTVKGLLVNNQYQFCVKAVNSAGVGQTSNVSDVFITEQREEQSSCIDEPSGGEEDPDHIHISVEELKTRPQDSDEREPLPTVGIPLSQVITSGAEGDSTDHDDNMIDIGSDESVEHSGSHHNVQNITDIHIQDILDIFNLEDLDDVYTRLGLKDKDIKNAKQGGDTPRGKAREVLTLWCNRYPEEATIGTIVKAIEECPDCRSSLIELKKKWNIPDSEQAAKTGAQPSKCKPAGPGGVNVGGQNIIFGSQENIGGNKTTNTAGVQYKEATKTEDQSSKCRHTDVLSVGGQNIIFGSQENIGGDKTTNTVGVMYNDCIFIEGLQGDGQELERKVAEILRKIGTNVSFEKVYRMSPDQVSPEDVPLVVVELSSAKDKEKIWNAAAKMDESPSEATPVDKPSNSRVNAKEQHLADMHTAIKNGNWVMERKFGHEGPGKLKWTSDVSICPNGDIAVADFKACRIITYNSNGDYKSYFYSDRSDAFFSHKRVKPNGIVVSDDGCYYVTDYITDKGSHQPYPYVTVYTAKGGYKNRFPAMSPDNIPSNEGNIGLKGIAIDNNGHVLVVAESGYISKHEQNGQHIGSIRVSINPDNLCVCPNGNIVISAWGSDTPVQVIDPTTGQVLYTLSDAPGVSRWCPAGVIAYGDVIFISNRGGIPHGIYCFSVTGQYIGCVTNEVTYPVGLAVTADGNRLIVTDEWDCVKILKMNKQ